MIHLPKEPSDPNLLAAMEKIKTVLREHDIAAIVLLESPTHGEWLNHITPSWSAAKWISDERGQGIHVHALAKDYPSQEAHKKALADTTGMLCGLRDGAAQVQRNMDQVLVELSKHISIEHVSRAKPHG